jgi:predicted nucleic acid-binding Zn ribbon protein
VPADPPRSSPDPAADLLRSALTKAKQDARARKGGGSRGRKPRAQPAEPSTADARADASPGIAPRKDSPDPTSLEAVLARVVAEQGWTQQAVSGGVLARWPELVGAEIAEHSSPTALKDGVLSVVAESTAWATQLKLLSGQLVTRLAEQLGPGVVTRLQVSGPTRPDWGHGKLRVRNGRGPRDTYG